MTCCPRCGQGWVVLCRLPGQSDPFRVCEECDTVWAEGEPTNEPPFMILEEYLAKFGKPPLWSNLERLEG